MRFIKRLFCKHKQITYQGISGGMGFSWRVMSCDNCGKEFESLTTRTWGNDDYRMGQKITAEDIEKFNDEIK